MKGLFLPGIMLAWLCHMAERNVVVVGASAGGVEALKTMMESLPSTLDVALLVVLHVSPTSPNALAGILGRCCPFPVATARDGEVFSARHVYVAPADRHLLVNADRLEVSSGPKSSHHRPSVDVLFLSAARWCGPRAIGVVLSGTLTDGAAGLRAVARRKGGAIVQDPSDALYAGMPTAALREVPTALVLCASAIGRALVGLSPDGADLEGDASARLA